MRKAIFVACLTLAALVHAGEPIKAVVVTGGHGYQKKPFEDMFKSFKGIECTFVQLKDQSEVFEDIDGWDYDVIVLYNLTQKISEKRKANFLKLLDQGVGLVALHHSMANYSDWSEYGTIIGGKYYLKAKEEYGKMQAKSGYKHGVDVPVQVVDKEHPVTAGVSDFTIHDETYSNYLVQPDVHVLLKTDHPTSTPALAWTRTQGKSRVVFIQLGHDAKAYSNPNYGKLVSQAIVWTCPAKP